MKLVVCPAVEAVCWQADESSHNDGENETDRDEDEEQEDWELEEVGEEEESDWSH